MSGSRILLFIVTFITWLMLSWSFSEKSLIAGFLISIVIAAVAGDLFTKNPRKMLDLKRYLWFFVYTGTLFWDMLKANIEVLFFAVSPHPQLESGVIEISTRLKSETGMTALANTLTLIQGMATVDISEQERKLVVHCVRLSVQKQFLFSKILKYEQLLARIYEES